MLPIGPQIVEAMERVKAARDRAISLGWVQATPPSPIPFLTPEQERERHWRGICPKIFHDTVLERLPCDSITKQKVLAFPILEKSLLLIGPTGAGKTRLAWLALKQNLGSKSLLAMDGMDFGSRASHAYREGDEAEWFQSMLDPALLFIDDVGKGRMTARVVEALFTIIDRRENIDKPILITMNYTIASLEAKLLREEAADMETTAALIRRMAENMTAIPI